MHLIPVIDLKNGLVVRASGGDRAAYKPIVTPLSPSADPVATVEGFLGVYPFSTFYIADLDALEGGASQIAVLKRLRKTFPGLEFWIDCGLKAQADLRQFIERDLGIPVLASETLNDDDGDDALKQRIAILSLDFKNGQFLGSPHLLECAQIWPERVIVMSIDSVGAGRGPDFERLMQIQALAVSRRLYAAGGVRNIGDVNRLQDIDVAGALISSALHAGTIRSAEIHGLENQT